MQVILVTLVLLANILGINAGTNFDASWTKTCPYGQYIWHVSSVHSNHHEDRSFTFLCKKDSKITRSCNWSGWVNWFDGEILYLCRKGVIAGVRSYHSNGHEDRRFKFECCRTQNNCATDCVWTGYVNNWDSYMSYAVPYGYFISGVQSYHDNGKEDRRWRFLICKQG